jgi:Ca-activated chloride channel family protein
MTMNIQTDRSLVRETGMSVRYVLVSFTAPDASRIVERQPLNVSFVIDRSGSMGGSKIELALTAVAQALRMLRDTDRFSVIAYDHDVIVVVPSTPATPEAVRNAVAQIQGLQARGSTDLGAGWLKGCEQIAQHLREGETTRCLLLSDGLANQGITDRDVLAEHSRELGGRGVRTSCLGIGNDYDERLLEAIAASSRGHSYNVETAVQIPDILTSELGEALETVARDVVVRVRPSLSAGVGPTFSSGVSRSGGSGPGGTVSIKSLNRYPLTTDGDGSASLQLGDLTARQEVALVFRLKFPAGRSGEYASALFNVTDAARGLSIPDSDIIWTFAGHAENDAQPRNRTVDRAVAELYAAAARAEALEMNREGRYEDSGARLEEIARKIEAYAGHDPVLRELVEELRQRHKVTYSAPMSAQLSKSEYASSLNASRMRDESGKARRRPTS